MLFIDKVTGTWGDADDIVFVDPDVAGQHMDPEGDDATCISTLESLDSDSEIIEIAEHSLKWGYGVSATEAISAYRSSHG